jgi:hypothetical protein
MSGSGIMFMVGHTSSDARKRDRGSTCMGPSSESRTEQAKLTHQSHQSYAAIEGLKNILGGMLVAMVGQR